MKTNAQTASILKREFYQTVLKMHVPPKIINMMFELLLLAWN